MSDEQSLGDPTEAPTPKKRSDARNKGQVPKSQELTTAFLLLASAMVITQGAGGLARLVAQTPRQPRALLRRLQRGDALAHAADEASAPPPHG